MSRQKREGKQKKVKDPPMRCKLFGKFGKWLFLFLIVGQNWLSVGAAAKGPQRGTEAVMRMQQEVQIKENRWTEATPKRWMQPNGEGRTEMKKEARRLRCTLLNGSAWSTEKQVCEKIERQVRYLLWNRAQIEEGGNGGVNKVAKEGWRFAADVARITDENAGTEDSKHTPGGVFVAVDSNVEAVIGKEGAIGSIPGNEGRIAPARVLV